MRSSGVSFASWSGWTAFRVIEYVYAHLVSLGVYRDFTAAVIGAIAARAITAVPLRRHQRAQKQMLANQRKTIDMLDTSTPGGLTDVMNAIHDERNDQQ
jgi:hypothetical protein